MDLFDEILATSMKVEQKNRQEEHAAQQHRLQEEQRKERALEAALQSHATRVLNAQKQPSTLDRVTQWG